MKTVSGSSIKARNEELQKRKNFQQIFGELKFFMSRLYTRFLMNRRQVALKIISEFN